jgi:hypothetical protein
MSSADDAPCLIELGMASTISPAEVVAAGITVLPVSAEVVRLMVETAEEGATVVGAAPGRSGQIPLAAASSIERKTWCIVWGYQLICSKYRIKISLTKGLPPLAKLTSTEPSAATWNEVQVSMLKKVDLSVH